MNCKRSCMGPSLLGGVHVSTHAWHVCTYATFKYLLLRRMIRRGNKRGVTTTSVFRSRFCRRMATWVLSGVYKTITVTLSSHSSPPCKSMVATCELHTNSIQSSVVGKCNWVTHWDYTMAVYRCDKDTGVIVGIYYQGRSVENTQKWRLNIGKPPLPNIEVTRLLSAQGCRIIKSAEFLEYSPSMCEIMHILRQRTMCSILILYLGCWSCAHLQGQLQG